MGLLAWIIFGGLAGWVASMIVGTRDRRGCIGNIILGIVGAFVGGLLVEVLTGRTLGMAFNLNSFIVAVIGSIVVIVVVRAVRKR